MDSISCFLIALAICCVIAGPISFIISLIALNKSREALDRLSRSGGRFAGAEPERPKEAKAEAFAQPQREPPKPPPMPVVAKPPMRTEPIGIREAKKADKARLEQRIGTRWILIAGIITVIVGVGFFLKYAYDNSLIGPLGRVAIAGIFGLAALAAGEVTRRRGYGIVSKGVTALGFAVLYAVVFASCRFYGLIGTVPAFSLAILLTTAAMLYAVSLDEMLIAVLSLLGGFLTPVLVSTGENRPIALFCYVLILGVGAILCAYYRKWRVVNLVVFVGTFLLYVGWFEKFYRPTMRLSEGMPEQMSIALSWLGVFFTVYLVLPMLHGLVKKIKAQREDVLLVVSNAAVTFVYLWQMLYGRYRVSLAFCAIGLCVAHLILMTLVARRCREDVGSRLSLLVVGLFFLTIAVPLYLKMYAVAMAWAAEGVVLAVIGRRYRSILTQVSGGAALLLGVGQLVYHLPMHTGAFMLVFNPAFGTWCFVVGAFAVCHVIYRKASNLEESLQDMVSQILYAATMLLLMSATAMEWHWHCRYNITLNSAGRAYFTEGMIILFTVFMLLFIFRPICPRGVLVRWIAVLLGAVGSIFLLVSFTEVYRSGFMVFANIEFVIALLLVTGLFSAAWLLKNVITEGEYNHIFVVFFALTGIVVLWVLLSEEIYLYWYCRNRYVGAVVNWRFLAGMYISVMWAIYGAALMAVGFWRRIVMLRYIALGLFALLLGKVFILDMGTVESVYRIAAFMATGITLVVVSYLYQYLRKRGFFEAMAIEKDADN